MSIIVESGAGLPDAETLASVEDADLYFSKRGISAWADLTNMRKEECLILATDYMSFFYRARWKGYRTYTEQALDWPRAEVLIDNRQYYPNNSIPKEVKNACVELALRASIGELSSDQSRQVTQETIGPVTVKYDEYSSPAVKYTSVDAMLAPYLAGSKHIFKLVRT